MRIIIKIDREQLAVINQLMEQIDHLDIYAQPKHLKSVVALCIELRELLLRKAISVRNRTKPFKLSLKYYMAEALYRYMNEFYIYWNTDTGSYEENVYTIIQTQLHQKL